MTERDVFESRLHAALLRHVANGPTDFDALAFARTVAAKEPRRHGFAAALTWRGFATPQIAWTLLLLAGLVAAMVGGMLVVGSQRVPRLPAVVPPVAPPSRGTSPARPATHPNAPGPATQVRPPAGFDGMVFDRGAGRIVVTSNRETWTFDVCTNTWAPERRRGRSSRAPGSSSTSTRA